MTVAAIIVEDNNNTVMNNSYTVYVNTYGKSDVFYKCRWFYNNKLEEGVFSEETLDTWNELGLYE